MKYVIENTILTVIVDGNKTTGFIKEVGKFDTSVLEHLKTEYIKKGSTGYVQLQNDQDKNVGVGGVYKFFFRIKKFQDTTIEIRTYRPWDESSMIFEPLDILL